MKREYRTIKPWQWERPGDVRLVVKAEGYAMVRRKGAMPFVITAKMWDEAPPAIAGEHEGEG